MMRRNLYPFACARVAASIIRLLNLLHNEYFLSIVFNSGLVQVNIVIKAKWNLPFIKQVHNKNILAAKSNILFMLAYVIETKSKNPRQFLRWGQWSIHSTTKPPARLITGHAGGKSLLFVIAELAIMPLSKDHPVNYNVLSITKP